MNTDHNSLKKDEDNPIWTEDDFKKAQPAQDVLPKEFFESMKRGRGERGKQKSPTKQQVTLRLDPDIIEYFKSATSDGWQTRLNQALKSYIDEHPLQ